MALRSLDNALPLTPERPRKLAKISVNAVPTPPGVNDENKAPTDTAAPEYIPSQDLKALTDPEAKLQGLLETLDSKDWIKVCEALNDVRRLAIHHSPLLEPALDKVLLVVVKSMKSPRSALCKTSIMASTDIFQHYGHLLLSSSSSCDAFDQLLLRLLLTVSQDKKFVCEEAEKALRAMATLLPSLPLLGKLASYVSHSNPKVRAKSAVYISNCVSKMALGEMKEFSLPQLMKISADILNDRLPEAREAARSIANSIYAAFTIDEEQKMSELPIAESWKNICSSNLPPMSAQAMVKAVSIA